MEKSGNIRTCSDCSGCSREDNLIAWRFIWKHWGDPYLKVNWQSNRLLILYQCIFKRCSVLLTLSNISAICLLGFYRPLRLNKIQKWKFKKRAPVYLTAKFNYFEDGDSSKSRNLSPAKYFYSKFAKLKSRENKG